MPHRSLGSACHLGLYVTAQQRPLPCLFLLNSPMQRPGPPSVHGAAGIAGGVPLAAAASNGITTAVLYNPYLASGSRYTVLADSQIQRLYHSNAFLLSSGEVR